MIIFGLGRHSRVASCFFRVFFSLSRFVVITHQIISSSSLFSTLPVPSRPTRNPSPSSSTLDDDEDPALHQSPTPHRTRFDFSTFLERRVEHRSPQLWPLHTSPSPLSPPPRAASSRFRARIGAISPVSVPSVAAPSYAVGGIAKLSRWLIPSSSSSSPLHPRP